MAFEPDVICRAIFEATQKLGSPDAFLAREITDSVLPFIGPQLSDDIPTTDALADIISKTIRELGHPILARRFAEIAALERPSTSRGNDKTLPVLGKLAAGQATRFMAKDALCQISLTEVFPPEIVAAHSEGVLILPRLDLPLEFAGAAIGLSASSGGAQPSIVELLLSAREYAGGYVAIDGPEFALANRDGDPEALASEFAREIRIGTAATGLAVIVNLNQTSPPATGFHLAEGPLFAHLLRTADDDRRRRIANALLNALSDVSSSDHIRVAWHVGDGPLRSSTELSPILRRAGGGKAIDLVIDRSPKNVILGEGLTRAEPALLLVVGIDLRRAAAIDGEHLGADRFIVRLKSLARLARSAGHAKLTFLRRYGRAAVREGFRLERSVLLVVPVGLQGTVSAIRDADPFISRRIRDQLQDSLVREPPHHLTAKLGTFPRFAGFACESEPSIAIGASLGESIRHAETISIQLTDNAWEDSEAIIKLIEMVRQHGQACRIRFDRAFTPAPFANSFWPEQPSIGDNRDN